MLKAAGITAEYNPLHNGHVYHIEETRRITGCDAVVVAMSGDYVQRGEPAVLDKWIRAEHALRNGADLVIEIPVQFCLGNAGQYAGAAVKILEATGKVRHISFGSESGDPEALFRIAHVLKDNADRIEAEIRNIRETGLSYPAARAHAYSLIMGELIGKDGADDPYTNKDISIPEKPNDVLAVEYIKSMVRAEPVAVPRIGSHYDSDFDNQAVFQSASAIRSAIFSGHDMSEYIPECTDNSLKMCHITGPDRDGWFDLLRYCVLSTDTEIIEDCPSGGEGLAGLMKASAASASSWQDFISKIKSKRYTYTRISRLCMQLILGISRSRYAAGSPEYIRVLGFNDKGRQLLAEMRDEESASLPVIINVNKAERDLSEKAAAMLKLDVHSADIYNLMTKGEIGTYSDRRRSPVIIDK